MDYDNGGLNNPRGCEPQCDSDKTTPADPRYAQAREKARYEAEQCNTKASYATATIVRDLQRQAEKLERQRNEIDHKLNVCRELLSIFN